MAGVGEPAALVQDAGRGGEEAVELAVVGDVREQVEQVARLGGGEGAAVELGEAPLALGGEVDEGEQAGEVEGGCVLAAPEGGLRVGA